MSKLNKRIYLKILSGLIILFFLITQMELGDEFYLNLLKDCRQEYKNKNFQKVLSNLKIAEFGLKENKDSIKTVYLYSIATHFKMHQMNKVKEYYDTLKREYTLTRLNLKDYPAEIKEDLLMADIFTRKGIINPVNWEERIKYEGLLYKTILNIQGIDDKKLVEINRWMKTIDKKDQRKEIPLIIIEYRKKNYKKVIKELQRVLKSPLLNLPEVKDKLYYYSALAHHHLKQHQKASDIIQKISDQAIVSQIQKLININKVDNKQQ